MMGASSNAAFAKAGLRPLRIEVAARRPASRSPDTRWSNCWPISIAIEKTAGDLPRQLGSSRALADGGAPAAGSVLGADPGFQPTARVRSLEPDLGARTWPIAPRGGPCIARQDRDDRTYPPLVASSTGAVPGWRSDPGRAPSGDNGFHPRRRRILAARKLRQSPDRRRSGVRHHACSPVTVPSRVDWGQGRPYVPLA